MQVAAATNLFLYSSFYTTLHYLPTQTDFIETHTEKLDLELSA